MEPSGRGPRLVGWVFLVCMACLLFIPFFQTLWKSFRSYDPALPWKYGQFVGLDNFSALIFDHREFTTSISVTIRLLVGAVCQFTLALCFALWLHYLWPKRLPLVVVVLSLTPLLVSATITGLMGKIYLHGQIGIISKILQSFGAVGAAPLASQASALFWISLLDAWRWVPFTSMLLWLCLQLAPTDELEAAALDGLGWRKTLRFVLLPRALGPFLAVFLIRMLDTLRLYDIPAVLTGGGPGTSTMTVSMFANRITFAHQRFGVASAHLVLLYVAVAILLIPLIVQVLRLRERLQRGAG